MKKQKSSLSKLLGVVIVLANVFFANSIYAATITTKLAGPWTTASNWDLGRIPTSSDDVVLKYYMTLGVDVTCNTLNIQSGGRLTVAAGTSVTVSGALTLGGNGIELLTTESLTASLIFASVSGGGNILYARNITGTSVGTKYWHTVSSPVNNFSIWNFLYNANGVLETNNDGSLFAFASYDESFNKWSYYPTTDNGSWTGVFAGGKCYTMAPVVTGQFTIQGKPFTGSVSINVNHSSVGTEPVGGWGWNAIGNPFTSAISASSFYLTNSGQLDPVYGGLYVWDPVAQGYNILTQGTGGYVQMGQGFVVRSKTGGGTVNFTYSMRAHSPGTAYKSANLLTGVQTSTNTPVQSIVLNAQSGKILRNTTFVFSPGMTTALDPYYDAGLLPSGGGLDIYSKLIDDKGINFGLQALPNTGFNELVIPVLIDLDAAGEVAFTSKLTNLPDGYKVVLEDRVTGATTSLNDDNAKYAVNLPANTVGLKRFYLHVSNLTTGIIENVSEGKLNVFTSGKSINILGSVLSQSKAYLYNLTGSRVAAYDLNASGTNVINIDQLKAGMYLIQIIEGKKQKYTGKIILN